MKTSEIRRLNTRHHSIVFHPTNLDQGKDTNSIFVFLHCQRTGGSNFQRWLSQVFGSESTHSVGTVGNYVRWHEIKDAAILDRKRLVSGFSLFKELDVPRPVVFLANVRHPAYRIISLVNLVRSKPDHFLHDLADKELSTFYREGRARKPHYFDNLQTRRLAGVYDADLAIENITTKFGAVGTTDDLSEMSEFLGNYYGWPVEPINRFEGPSDEDRYSKRIGPDLFEEISKDNALDVALYDFVRSRQPQSEPSAPSKSAVLVPESGEKSAVPSLSGGAGKAKTYSVPVDSIENIDRIIFNVGVPLVPDVLRSCDFAEHVFDAQKNESTGQVIILGRGRIGVSNDLGETWRCIQPPACRDIRFHNSFTTRSGRHIVQAKGWQRTNDTPYPEERHGRLFVFSEDWELIRIAKAGDAAWHGSASIAEKNGTIMYSEYHDNGAKYGPEQDGAADTLRPCAIWRSRDDGLSWEKVFEQSADRIRHFHTLVADPFGKDVWWASSGDRSDECRVWMSTDNGDMWIDCTEDKPGISIPHDERHTENAAHRFTDLAILEHDLIWGSDDLMGKPSAYDPGLPLHQRAGSRVYRTAKTVPLHLEEVAYIGQPVRSMIDVVKGWVLVTEAKHPTSKNRASFFFLDKGLKSLVKLCDADNYVNRPTGFTFSKASRKSHDNVFFSFKQSHDLQYDSPRIARYEVLYVTDE